MGKQLIVVAPHPDDEIIGCFELLERSQNPLVLYPEINELPLWCKSDFNPLNITPVIDKDCDFYFEVTKWKWIRPLYAFPDPVYEFHPLHRKYGMIGEQMFRQGADVIFYSVNMQAPYIREVINTQVKKDTLNRYYLDKNSLWEYDHKYFLFEGQCKWIGGW